MKTLSYFSFLFLFICCASPALAECSKIDGLLDINCDGKLVIEAFGDSITRGEGDSADIGYPGRLLVYFPYAIIRNYGRSGEDTPRGKTRARTLFPHNPDADYVILLEGVNDYWDTGHSSTRTRSNLYSIMNYGARIGAIVLLGNLTQVKRGNQAPWVRAVNSRIKAQADLDFYSLGNKILSGDGLHPNANGYDRMAAVVANKLLDISGN